MKMRVIAHAQQVVRVDKEDEHCLAAAHIEGICGTVQVKQETSKGIIVSDYAKGVISSQVFERVKAGYQDGALGYGKIPVVVDPKAANFSVYSQATVITPNRAEAEAASGMLISDRSGALAAGKLLLKRWNCEMVLITLGDDGMVLVSGVEGEESALEIDTVARDVYDVSGAGDTVTALFTLAISVGASPREAAELANIGAGIVVGEVGTAALSVEQLKDTIIS